MKRAKFFLMAIGLAGLSTAALGQRGGYHSGHSGRPAVDVQQQVKIRASDEQRTQLRTCLGVSERLRMVAAEMKKPAHLSETEWTEARRRWNEVLSHAMQNHHQVFVDGLNAEQQAALKDRVRQIDKTRSELASRFETMDRDLAEAVPDAKRVSAHAKELEKSLKKWQKQHRALGSEIGIEG